MVPGDRVVDDFALRTVTARGSSTSEERQLHEEAIPRPHPADLAHRRDGLRPCWPSPRGAVQQSLEGLEADRPPITPATDRLRGAEPVLGRRSSLREECFVILGTAQRTDHVWPRPAGGSRYPVPAEAMDILPRQAFSSIARDRCALFLGQ